MDLSGFKKKRNSKEAWLDWLSDDAPSAEAQADTRRRHVQRANAYQPRQFTPQSGVNQSLTGQAQPQSPGQPVQQPSQAQPVSQTVQSPRQPQTAPVRPQATSAPASAGSGVSIQINIPQLRLDRLRRLRARIRGRFAALRAWYLDQLADHMGRTMALSAISVLVVAGLVAGPFLHLGSSKAGKGTAAAGSTVKYKKPPFKVIVPPSKPKLATPDGVHAAYDGNKNVYSFSDTIGNNGFILSEQPIPDKFNTAQDAISSIGPQIYGATATNHTVNTFAGDAFVTVSSKGAQTVIFSTNNLLMFIQSSYKFSDTQIQDYINALQ